MRYLLKHEDTSLICFDTNGGANPNIEIVWIDNNHLFPLDLKKVNGDSLLSWIKHRSIPKNRAYVNNLLNIMGLSINRPLDIICKSKGLSLNDNYWIVEEGYDGSFKDNNLYDNHFSRVLSEIAFTGDGSSRNLITSSPEYTTNGMLPKCWRRVNGTVYLYKGATSGFSNTGYEPYSEYYAYQIAEKLGIKAVEYNLSKWKGNLCSTCKLFTGKDESYIPVGRLITSGGYETAKKYYEELGGEYLDSFKEMIVFDAIISNTDRHFGNFGFLVDNKTNKIMKPAPLFDHGNSLLSLIGPDRLSDEKKVIDYVDNLYPCVYDDFIIEARKCLSPKLKKKLIGLQNIKLKKHPRYNVDSNRLAMIEKAIQYRIGQLLK